MGIEIGAAHRCYGCACIRPGTNIGAPASDLGNTKRLCAFPRIPVGTPYRAPALIPLPAFSGPFPPISPDIYDVAHRLDLLGNGFQGLYRRREKRAS